MEKHEWPSYSELAWTEPIIAPPEEYEEETELFIKVIKEHSRIEPNTLLHLGCGAGGNDYTFKMHFKVTGVDISEGMLEIARKQNPEVTYIYDDMRSIELRECFDAVAIPDSIGYMTTLEDLRSAVLTAYMHLKPGGVLLIIASIAEQFSWLRLCRAVNKAVMIFSKALNYQVFVAYPLIKSTFGVCF